MAAANAITSSIINIFSSLKLPSNSPTLFQSFTPSLNFSGKLLAKTPTSSSSSSSILLLRRKHFAGAAIMFPQNPVLSDVCAFLVTAVIARATLAIWELTAKFQLFDSVVLLTILDHPIRGLGGKRDTKLCGRLCFCCYVGAMVVKYLRIFRKKLVHISVGLVFMLCWPLFSSGYRGAFFACLVLGVNIIRVLLIGLGIYKDEATVKSMSRFGGYRELLKGPLYYAVAIAIACFVFWRTSPIGIAAICNLCAGDGLADIVGRRLGKDKLPYNINKSYAGTIAMAIAGFVASVGYMHYFSLFGFMQESSDMVLQFLVVSLISSLVESLPISTQLDDNLTVPLTSFLAGSLLF